MTFKEGDYLIGPTGMYFDVKILVKHKNYYRCLVFRGEDGPEEHDLPVENLEEYRLATKLELALR